jgi:hypothetical protein
MIQQDAIDQLNIFSYQGTEMNIEDATHLKA